MIRACLALMLALAASAQAEERWPLIAPTVPFDDSSPFAPLDYVALDRAAQPWRICILYPHLKDAYWLSVNYGMVEEARRLGVSFDLFEAGGYPNIDRQREQLAACADDDFDAVILGTVSYDGLTEEVERIAARKPVIATVNDIDDRGITAKASVPWREMGAAAGRFIAGLHPSGSAAVNVAWFPGPAGAGWVPFVEEGFRAELAKSSARLIATKYGDTGLEQQVLLVEEVLDAAQEVDYLVGSGPMAEAAVSILRARGRIADVGIVSTYLSHAVYRGITRGRILAAPTDFPVVQGRLSVEMAVRAIEGKLTVAHAGPRIEIVTSGSAKSIGTNGSLAPASFVPVFAMSSEGAPAP